MNTFILSLICNILVLIVIFSQSERDTMKNELKENIQKIELEEVHYQEIERKRQELSEIMKMHNKVITDTKQLLETGNADEAIRRLENLQKTVEQTKEYPFCQIPIVNVILSDKQKECEKNGIAFEADIHIPNKTKIGQMDFCRIFGNMLDNAIRESRLTEDARIQLKVGIAGEYLIIKCINPIRSNTEKKNERTGYGLKILKDIAINNGGDVRVSSDEKQFEVQLSLRY